MQPTEEQESVLNSTGQVIKVAAFAGAGKSSTLMFLASRFPTKRILYIAFNRSVVLEAKGKFPSNTTVVTGHGLAYKAMAGPYKHKLANDIKAFELVALDCLPFPSRATKETRGIMADGAIKVLTEFLQTDVFKIENIDKMVLHDKVLKKVHLGCGTFSFYIKMASILWAGMINPSSNVPYIHDAYVKMYQLSKPVLEDYDILALDEAQDTNGVLAFIVENQKHMRRFYIGDSHQNLYSFRGSIDMMKSVNFDKEFNLTGSFRFGQDLADVANVLLRGYKGETAFIRGLGPDTEVNNADGEFLRDGHAYVARTNSGVFEKAFMGAKENRPMRFIGGLSGYKLSLIVDSFYFCCGRKPFSEKLKYFRSFKEMKEMAKALDDMELNSMVGLVMRLGTDIPKAASKIKALSVRGKKTNDSEIILTTAHKSKGLEFDHGELCNDFAKLYEPGGVLSEEVNLSYVGVTRFKKSVALPQVIVDSIEYDFDEN